MGEMRRLYVIATTALVLWALTFPLVWVESAWTTEEGACRVYFSQLYDGDAGKAARHANAMYARARRELLSYYMSFMPADVAWQRVMQRRGPELGADFLCQIWMSEG